MNAKPYLIEVTLLRDQVSCFDEYPFNIPSIMQLETLSFHPDVTFIIGDNGTGKSTLIEAIALTLGFGAEGGTKNVQVDTTNSVSCLHNYLKTVKSFQRPRDHYFLRAESFYNIATYMDQTGYLQGYGGESLHCRSHGEAFLVTLTNKLRGKGLYLLDEPEAALSPTRQMAALSSIHQLVNNDSQFIIATHSPILMAYPKAKLLHLSNDGIQEVLYEDTDHFNVTRDFLNNYQRMIERLVGD